MAGEQGGLAAYHFAADDETLTIFTLSVIHRADTAASCLVVPARAKRRAKWQWNSDVTGLRMLSG